MAIYRNVQMSFWTDRKIAEEFTPNEKYMYLFLMTNPLTNLCGCYEIGYKQISNMTGLDVKTVKGLIKTLQETHRIITYSEKTAEILILNWHRYNWTDSDKFRKPLLKEIESVKDDTFKAYLTDIFRGADTVSIPYQYRIDTTVTVTDTDTVSVKNKRNVFVKPTVEEVRAYCRERNNNIDAESFVAYYDSTGWKIGGKSAMRDWRAAVRTWEKREQPKPKKQSFGNQRNYDFAELEKKLLQG